MLKGYLTLELTHSKIRYIFLTRNQQGYKILKSGIVPQVLNIHAPGELSRALQDLIQREGMDPLRLFVTLCLQENYIRQLDVPKTNPSKLEQDVTEEIKKTAVFGPRKFDYIFDVSYKKADQGSLVFAAVEQTVLDYVLSECRSLGRPFAHLEIAPLNLKEIFPLVEPDIENHTVLFVNDHVSYLMTALDEQWRLISRSTIGAEHLYPKMNDKLNPAYFINLAGDLKRVINAFASSHKIEKPERLWIIWDQQGAADLASALADKLGLDVQALNLGRIAGFNVDQEVQNANPMDLICVLPAILYLQRIKEQFPLNHFFRAQQYKKYVLNLFITSMLILCAAGFGFGMKTRDYYLQQRKLNIEMEAFASSIEHFKSDKKKLYRMRDEYSDARKNLLDHLNHINVLNQLGWPQALSVFIKQMPDKKMALTSFKFDDSGHIAFSGEALDVKDVNAIVTRLEKSHVFEEGLINSLTEKTAGTQKISIFRIIAKLREQNDQKN